MNIVGPLKHSDLKDSGAEWLGTIPTEWETRKLKYVVKILKRIAGFEGPSVLSITQKGIKIKDIESGEGQLAQDYSKYQLTNRGDFAMNHMDLLTGYVDISPFEGVVSPDYRVFRNCSADVLDEYLLLIFQIGYTQKVFFRYGQGVSLLGRWRLPADNFNEFLIPIPPLDQQHKIVEFLTSKVRKIDEAVRIKEAQIKLLLERRQILIQQAVTRGLNPDAPMKDSGIDWIGRIPAHWDVKRLRHLTTKIGSGITPTGGALVYVDDGIPLLRSQNVLFGKIDLNNAARISHRVHHRMRNSIVRKGDVLLNITGGSIGRCHFVEVEDDLNVNQHVCIVRPTKAIHTEYLNMLLTSTIGQRQIWHWQQGGGREGLNFEAIKAFTFSVPHVEEQGEIVSFVKASTGKIDAAISIKQDQISALKEYKTSLINAAVTGKIKVI